MLCGMAFPDRIYRRSAAGLKMLTSPGRTCPLEHQRILALIDQDTHSDVVRGSLRQFPDALLADWLAEMEELGYLSSTLAEISQNLDFTGLFTAPRSTPTPLVQEVRAANDHGSLDARRLWSFPVRGPNQEPRTTAQDGRRDIGIGRGGRPRPSSLG